MPRQKAPGNRTIRETTYLFEDEAEALEERAFKERISKSEIIRRAIRAYLRMDK